MREFRSLGSVRGVRGNAHPYRSKEHRDDEDVSRPTQIAGREASRGLWKPEPVRPVSKAGEAWREDLATQYTPSLEKERFRWWADQP